MLIALPVVVMLLGAFLYFAGPGKWHEVGRVMFGCGLLVALLAVGHGGALKLW